VFVCDGTLRVNYQAYHESAEFLQMLKAKSSARRRRDWPTTTAFPIYDRPAQGPRLAAGKPLRLSIDPEKNRVVVGGRRCLPKKTACVQVEGVNGFYCEKKTYAQF